MFEFSNVNLMSIFFSALSLPVNDDTLETSYLLPIYHSIYCTEFIKDDSNVNILDPPMLLINSSAK